MEFDLAIFQPQYQTPGEIRRVLDSLNRGDLVYIAPKRSVKREWDMEFLYWSTRGCFTRRYDDGIVFWSVLPNKIIVSDWHINAKEIGLVVSVEAENYIKSAAKSRLEYGCEAIINRGQRGIDVVRIDSYMQGVASGINLAGDRRLIEPAELFIPFKD